MTCGTVDNIAIVVIGVHDPHQSELSEVAQTDRSLALFSYSVECRH
jgi:hypothetical protein